eukprot:Platyproteum_vivax@DN13153_c0_g1_i1.p1
MLPLLQHFTSRYTLGDATGLVDVLRPNCTIVRWAMVENKSVSAATVYQLMDWCESLQPDSIHADPGTFPQVQRRKLNRLLRRRVSRSDEENLFALTESDPSDDDGEGGESTVSLGVEACGQPLMFHNL